MKKITVLLKNQILLFSILIGLSSCSSLRRSTASAAAKQPAQPVSRSQSTAPVFLETVTIKPAGTQHSTKSTSTAYPAKSAAPDSEESPATMVSVNTTVLKYAILLDIPVEAITDTRLIEFMESWYGTPYRYGGNDRTGVDCSAFTKDFMSSMYNITIPRVSAEQYRQSKRIARKDLQEGDLVFFYTKGKRRGITHVGVYLTNNKFIHAATSGGVMISDLNDVYYERTYAGAGRYK